MATKRARKRLVRSLAPGAVGLVVACGAKVHEAHPVPSTKVATAAPAASNEQVVEPLPTFETLAARQVRLAPGMRELARGDTASPVTLPSATRDLCVRVAYAAREAVTATIVARDGAVLATSGLHKDGVLDARGPVCFHPVDEPRLYFRGDAGVVRYVVWGSP